MPGRFSTTSTTSLRLIDVTSRSDCSDARILATERHSNDGCRNTIACRLLRGIDSSSISTLLCKLAADWLRMAGYAAASSWQLDGEMCSDAPSADSLLERLALDTVSSQGWRAARSAVTCSDPSTCRKQRDTCTSRVAISVGSIMSSIGSLTATRTAASTDVACSRPARAASCVCMAAPLPPAPSRSAGMRRALARAQRTSPSASASSCSRARIPAASASISSGCCRIMFATCLGVHPSKSASPARRRRRRSGGRCSSSGLCTVNHSACSASIPSSSASARGVPLQLGSAAARERVGEEGWAAAGAYALS
eukprot:256355-Chlamydomonas_euryale.AAC.4